MGRRTPLSKYTDDEIFAECARRNRAKQTHLPNPPVLRLCPKGCGQKFNARAMRAHTPHCEGKKE